MLQDCDEKTSVLDRDGSQVLSLTTTDSRAGCRLVSSENGSLDISCQGKVKLFSYKQQRMKSERINHPHRPLSQA